MCAFWDGEKISRTLGHPEPPAEVLESGDTDPLEPPQAEVDGTPGAEDIVLSALQQVTKPPVL